ncbi:hypothetical protein AB0392_60135 [Nonomuraea angiospora]|uniref:hypothetical protein n=1 Tax=Nonomuraea angiospora TaxID=46172 RepID=UPI00344FC52F
MTATIARLADNLLQRLVPRAEAAAACPGCGSDCQTRCCTTGARVMYITCCPRIGSSGCNCYSRGDC